MADSLMYKTLKGVGWNSIDRIANYGISFIVSIVLARLLIPEDYGLIGIITIFISIFNVILDGGFSTALIRKENVTDEDYNTVFYSNIVVSIFLAVILCLCAPIISIFFKRPELVPLIRVMSTVLIIDAFSITQRSILTKKIDFKTQAKISLISFSISGIIGIVLAILGCGVWALVAQQLSGRFLIAVFLWIFNKWFPRLLFSWASFMDLFNFSWKLLITRVLTILWGQMYQGVIGKCYDYHTLGLYTRAVQYGQLFSSGISDVVLKVSLPVMSTMQDSKSRLLNATQRIIKVTMYVTCIAMIGLAASAPSFVYVLIGEKWLSCVPMLQILCFNLIINPLAYINENLLTVEGRSDKLLILQFMKMTLSTVPLVLGILGNLYMMLISSAIVSWASVFIYTYYTNKYYEYNWRMQLQDILPSFLSAIVMGIPVYLLNFISISDFFIFPLQLLVGAMIVIVLGECFKQTEYLFIKGIIVKTVIKRCKR